MNDVERQALEDGEIELVCDFALKLFALLKQYRTELVNEAIQNRIRGKLLEKMEGNRG